MLPGHISGFRAFNPRCGSVGVLCAAWCGVAMSKNHPPHTKNRTLSAELVSINSIQLDSLDSTPACTCRCSARSLGDILRALPILYGRSACAPIVNSPLLRGGN
ncbi:hypothetical protein D8M31_09760 [Corynebacterium genitalium]|nr:hypothetical protein D8M31_09760 [Corynebacterium genitalium]